MDGLTLDGLQAWCRGGLRRKNRHRVHEAKEHHLLVLGGVTYIETQRW